MTPSLKISEKIINRLESDWNKLGKLYGIISHNTVLILGLQLEDGDIFINSLPAEVYLCGVIQIGGEAPKSSIENVLQQVDITDNPVVLKFNSNSQLSAFYYINEQFETVAEFSQVTEQDIWGQYLYLRLTGSLPFSSQLLQMPLSEAFASTRKEIASGAITFGVRGKNIFLLRSDTDMGVVGVNGGTKIGELPIESSEPGEDIVRKKKNVKRVLDVVDLVMLKRMTGELGVVIEKDHAPLCVLDKKQGKTLNMSLTIDTLSMVHRDTQISDLYEILVESAIRNLRLIEKSLSPHIEENISIPEIFHFYPENCGHFVTMAYLKDRTDESLVGLRRQIHKDLLLGESRPCLRRGNAFLFKTKENTLLLNPHEGVKFTDNNGRIALVKGIYQYYHYCQNKMDDNGWGCAYRSLQTLASWFKLQGYTEKNVPTFQEIQKCLVDINDKPPSFVGSRQWIGSTEVNFVLSTLMGVTSKILYVSSGEEMATKGPELVSHFENHGAPVMIGGGVLAHTILGVDYNSQSGTIKFLILDPHYTGGEDLLIIQSKGWCGWKGVDFWDKRAYYNMCLPQVPHII